MTKKSLLRRELMVLPNVKPAPEELEMYQKEKERFLIVIMTRWYFVLVLTAFFFFTFFFFSLSQDIGPVLSTFLPYLILTAFIAGYNFILNMFNEKIAAFKGATIAQIFIDIIFASTFLYLAGGIISWFWVLYPIIILESAFLFEGRNEIWLVSFTSSLAYMLVLIIQSFQGITQTTFPFTILVSSEFSTYAVIISSWVLAVNSLAAFSGIYLSKISLKKKKDLQKRVVTDGLTNLYDHNYFYKMLESEIKLSERFNRSFSLIMIDIDDFKNYNDLYGHQRGDQLLTQISKVLSQNIRKKDVDLVFRYGGEEFAVIVPEIRKNRSRPVGAIALAERLRKKIKDEIKITVSIGVGSYPHHGKTTAEFFNNVDKALFEAKDKGKDRVVIAKVKRKEKAA